LDAVQIDIETDRNPNGYPRGSTSFNLQVSVSEATVAQCSAPPSEPANSAFFRMERSTVLLSS
jgi:hypothetical protein